MGKRTIRFSLKDIILNYVTENFNKYLLVIVIFNRNFYRCYCNK